MATAVVTIRVIPRAGRTAVAGMRGEAVVIRLAAAPLDGAANDTLIAFVAATLGCPRRDIAIVSGEKSRDKRLRIEGFTAEDVHRRLKPDS
jgi:uncharacterized protein (TIGR00251 family)